MDLEEPLVSRRRGRITNGFKFGACFSVTLIFLWALALIVLLYLVHMQIVFLNPPKVVQSGIPYYNKPVPGPIDGTKAEVNSFGWFVYASDLLLTLPVVIVPMLFMIDLLFSAGVSVVGSVITFVLFALLEAAKSVYFTFIWVGWFGLLCEEEPFCVSRDPASPASTPDSTFVLEAIFTYGFTLFSILLAILLPVVFRSGQKDRERFLQSRANALPFGQSATTHEKETFGDMIVGDSIQSASSSTKRRVKQGKSQTSSKSQSTVVNVAALASQRHTPSILD